eukprot:1000102-Prorocentrum_minimum.AAC.2
MRYVVLTKRCVPITLTQSPSSRLSDVTRRATSCCCCERILTDAAIVVHTQCAQGLPRKPASPYKVLVSCWEGKSASVTVLASYLLVREKKKLPYVMGLIKNVHPDAEPNKGFARNLRYLDRNNELPEWVIP